MRRERRKLGRVEGRGQRDGMDVGRGSRKEGREGGMGGYGRCRKKGWKLRGRRDEVSNGGDGRLEVVERGVNI